MANFYQGFLLNDVSGDFLTHCPSRGWSLKAQPFNASLKHQVTIPSPQRHQTLVIKSLSERAAVKLLMKGR